LKQVTDFGAFAKAKLGEVQAAMLAKATADRNAKLRVVGHHNPTRFSDTRSGPLHLRTGSPGNERHHIFFTTKQNTALVLL
jgi:hypothetical protein